MASKVEIKFKLKEPKYADALMSDEFFARYMKDDYIVGDIIGSYYDTAYGELAAANCRLRVRRINRVTVADLKQGSEDANGVFRGQYWVCKFGGAHSVMENLRERGAPEIPLKAPLAVSETFKYRRSAATLYMPDMVRAELSFDAGDRGAELGLELLYGAGAELVRFAEEFRKDYADILK